MGEFVDGMLDRVPAGFTLAAPLVALLSWVEREGVVARGRDGDLYGALSDGRSGTDVELRGFAADETEAYVASWFGTTVAVPRIWPFCRTGADGSHAALWDDHGRMRVVHLGSGSGSMLTCVLADDPVDFLRLLAIGYDEICWNDQWDEPPVATDPDRPDWSPTHAALRGWVTETFGVSLPARAVDVVAHPTEMDDEHPTDDWARCVLDVIGRG